MLFSPLSLCKYGVHGAHKLSREPAASLLTINIIKWRTQKQKNLPSCTRFRLPACYQGTHNLPQVWTRERVAYVLSADYSYLWFIRPTFFWVHTPPSFHRDQQTNFVAVNSLTSTHLIFQHVTGHDWPPLCLSGQSSWLQIQRSGFDFRRYQIFWEVVGLERGPLSLVSTTEELTELHV
jgi:hypothetical protein